MGVDLSVFHKIKTKADFDREEELFQERKRAAQVKATGQDPAAVKLANEIQKARASGDTQRVNDLMVASKSMDKGLIRDESGRVIAMGGYGDALGQIGYGKKYGEQSGTETAKDQHEPWRAGAKAQAEKNVDLAMNPQIKGAESDAVFSSKIENQPALDAANARQKAMDEARANLPGYEAQAGYMLDTLDKMQNHPGREYATGGSSVLPIIPGTDAAGFMALYEQAHGKQFMEAYEGLKGGGVITEIEGQKATQALSRMNRSTSEEEFIEAAQEFERYVRDGLVRARTRAENPYTVTPNETPNTQAPKPGTRQGDYMYTGGDPSKQENWKKVQ